MAATLRFAQPCTACGQPAHDVCDDCNKPHCSHGQCLFLTGDWITEDSDPRNEDYAEHPTWNREEELCMECYTTKKGHAPIVLWEHSIATSLILSDITPGAVGYAGDAHSWYSAPRAGKCLHLKWSDQHIELDTFRTVQLLNYLKANEATIHEQAKKISKILVEESNLRTSQAIKADSGFIDYSQYE